MRGRICAMVGMLVGCQASRALPAAPIVESASSDIAAAARASVTRSRATTGALGLDLSAVGDEVPLLGPPTTKAQPEDSSTKLDIGPIEIVSPAGWSSSKLSPGYVLLTSNDERASVVLTGFHDPTEARDKVESLVTTTLKLRGVHWQRPKTTNLGDDASLPTILSVGHATNQEGNGVRLFFAAMSTDRGVNVLAVGGQAESAGSTQGLMTALAILAQAKRQSAAPQFCRCLASFAFSKAAL